MRSNMLPGTYVSLLPLLLTSSLLAQTNVLTQHNDIGRTGLNSTETILTPANVSSGNFGKLYTVTLDGRVWTQPLYVSNLTIAGVNHSVVFVATGHDTVYALDANANGAVLWKASLLDTAHGAAAGAIPDPESDTGCTDVDAAEYGVTGTPVIDLPNGTLYVVSTTFEGNYPVQRLHALNITNGSEKLGGPVTIAASVPGNGPGNINGNILFDPKWSNQRPGLLLVNGTVYIGWASHCDYGIWHGWIMGYNSTTLKQVFAFNTSPNMGDGGGVWMSGAGLAADLLGPNGTPRMFVATGNGVFDPNNNNWGESVLNLNLSGSGKIVTDSFTPNNENTLNTGDVDLGSAGTLVLPDQPGPHPHLIVQLSKAGTMFLLDREKLGGFNPTGDQALQELTFGSYYSFGIWGMPAYFNGNIYFWAAIGRMQQWSLTNGVLSSSPTHVGSQNENGLSPGGYDLGATPSISANGTNNGIVWTNDSVADQGNPFQYLLAHDATDVSQTLWSSAQNPSRDFAGGSQKFAVPSVADGKVFLASDSQLQVYGLLPANFAQYTLTAFQTSLTVASGSSASTQISVTPIGSFSGLVQLTASGLPAGVTATFTPLSANSFTMTLTASPSAPPPLLPATVTVTVTVTGVSGAMSTAIPLSVTVSRQPAPLAVNMTSSYNIYGAFLNHVNPTNGGLDGGGWAYSANLLGHSLSALGVNFYFGPADSANAVSSATVPLPAGHFSTLYLAGAAVNGNFPNESFVVNYTDGSSTAFTQSLSDWCVPQSYPGETIASTMTYRVGLAMGTTGPACNLYAYSFLLNPAKTVASIALPANRNVVVLAMTLVPAASSTINFLPIPTQIAGTSVTIAATASSGLPVTFTSNSPAVCTVSGSTVALIAAGTCSITASQAGNGIYPAAIPVTNSFTVNAAAQTINFPSISTQHQGASFTASATASSGLPVTFTSTTPAICTVSGSTVTAVAPGTCFLTASQPGNNVYAPASPVTNSFAVTGATSLRPQTINFPPIPLQTVGTSFTPTASASSGLAVTFASNTPGVCTVTGATVNVIAGGICSITASQAGNNVYAAAIPVTNSFAAQRIVNMATAFNVTGIATNGSPVANGGLDTASYAYSANVLGSTVSALGLTFTLGPAGRADASANITIALPAGNFSSLKFLGAAVFGSQTGQSFVVTYTDGSTSVFTQSLSDWLYPQNYAGETVAVTMPYRLAPNGSQQFATTYVYGYSLALNNTKVVKSIALPAIRNVTVLAITLQ